MEAKATVDSAYEYSRRTSFERVKRNSANPSDVLRLVKQPAGPSRVAARAADYMDNAVRLIKKSWGNRQKRSINATDLISAEVLQVLAELTGCSAQQRPPPCKTTPYLDKFRTQSGVCNNKQNNRWGSSNTPLIRLCPPEYQNEEDQPKGWYPEQKVNKHKLPRVREVSNQILSTANSDVESDKRFTHLLTIFGQFTDHDLTFTPHSPVIRSFNNGIDCDKSCDRTEPCFPIEIPEGDRRFGRNSHECMPFFRSAPACGSGKTGYNFGQKNIRQQMNSITAFIDVGQVYGSDDSKAHLLRDLTSDKGLLRVNTKYTDNGRELLPFTNMSANMCATRARITNNDDVEDVPCFLAGDERSNENIGLTSLHTLLMREHNRLARALAKLNPHWNGERLYQEARKIMGGYFQVLTFRDYLPIILGPDIMAKQLSTYPGYDESVDPSISNVFATAAFRFAHLMVQPFMFRLDEKFKEHPKYPSPLLHRAFFTPWRVVFEGGVDPILRGLVGRRAKLNTQEHMMPDELRERLFKFSIELALDLASLNMQRGRDHGLPGYNKWRKFCGLSQPHNQRQLGKVLKNNVLAKNLIDHYGTPENIDVWLGGVAEPFVRKGRVGPLFACLVASQFQRIRQGDRLWWENKGVFTMAQRESLKKTSLSRIICDNTGITRAPENPFLFQRRSKFTKSINRLKRSSANPSDILRLVKQPVGPARTAVRAAEYMDNAVSLLRASLGNRRKRSINATDLISEDDLQVIARLTGCSAQERPPSCKTTPNLNKYRTASSVCNNREKTRWGSSNRAFTRWVTSEYEDGSTLPKAWDPTHKINGFELPMVRKVSNDIMRTANEVDEDPLFTHLLTIFAQMTDHDLTFTPHTPTIRSFNNGIDCDKTCDRTEPCFPIRIPKGDRRFGRNSHECMPFFRSAPACGSGKTGYNFGQKNIRQQMNTLTAFIDVGQVYGSDDSKAHLLRDLTSDKGLLRVNTKYTDNGRELLPFQTGPNMCATRARITNDSNAEDVPCFLAGDERSNENIGLTSLHTLLMREHNRLARALAELNPQWDGETLYQEARKIMGGYLQVLTFRDFLPRIVGPDIMAKQLSTYPGYNDSVDPSISNVFATAAFRFAHLMIQPFMFRLDENYKEHSKYPSPLLHRAFFAPWRVVFEGGVDPILRGLVGRRAKLNTQDHMMPDELRERLFKFSAELALDLASLNLQRGRDHGLPGYNKWRKFCGLSEPRNLAELARVLNNTDLAKKLLDLYGTPDNIDVWLGGAAEPLVRGGRVGPLFACLIATQFEKIRQGDRLWWENKGVFTEAQRNSLMKTSIARMICDNTGITEVPEKPFQYRPRGSGYTQCKDIPAFDLSSWKEDGDPSSKLGSPGPRGPPGPPGPPGMVQKIAFSVRLGNSFPKTNQPILFRDVIYNGQNSYNIKTGFFTCEHAGVYEFNFYCTISAKSASLDLMRNGEVILHSFNTVIRGATTASGSVNIKLKKGDRVWLLAKRNLNGLTKDSIFSGHLLFTE
ncbi:uncharacterized protein ABDE67_001280 [Symphorus nematophorus]